MGIQLLLWLLRTALRTAFRIVVYFDDFSDWLHIQKDLFLGAGSQQCLV